MAINIDTIQFLLKQINSADFSTYKSLVSQLFNYFESEIKDNPVYEKYLLDFDRLTEEFKSRRDQILSRNFNMPENYEEGKSFAFAVYKTIATNDGEWVKSQSMQAFRQRNYPDGISRMHESLFRLMGMAIQDIVNANPEFEGGDIQPVTGDTVFIIHGHDNDLKREVQNLLDKAGVTSIILHEAADKGRTIIDKLIDETNKAAYGIALLTPDDLTNDQNYRARQNVILEIGYFLGRLGKERIRMIIKGKVEIPSDLSGILYEKYDDDGAWKTKLLKELRAVGISVDLNSFMDRI